MPALDETRVIILSPGVRPARRIAQVEVLLDQLGQAQAPGEGGRKDQPGIGHQAVVVEGDLDTVGMVSTTVAEQRRVESRQSRAGEVRRW